MAIKAELHEQDKRELMIVRRALIGWRYVSGLTQQQLAQKAGHSEKWISELEQGISCPKLSSLQDWAWVFDLRVQPTLELPNFAGFPVPFHVDVELRTMWSLAKPFDAKQWVRAWCVAELIWERHWRGISAADLSRSMGTHFSSVSSWERDGNDPMLSKLFAYARALGGRMRFQLVERDEWEER